MADNHTDRTFITNEEGQSLLERLKVLMKSTQSFDVLVGYFYTSGFHAIYETLEKTEKVRILIGIKTDKTTHDMIKASEQLEMTFSDVQAKKHFTKSLVEELENAQDSRKVEEGIAKFIQWVKKDKLEIRVYPDTNIHAKLYIMSFHQDSYDVGRVITGSSNLSRSGLIDNLEFNVELKSVADHDFAKQKFNELWEDAVDVGPAYIDTVQKKTWLSKSITPYELYLKFLYEHFKYELDETESIAVPAGFKQLKYQEQAVLNAKRILDEHGGVFISDVVGLGKTYVSAMLAKTLGNGNLVLAPPALLDEANPGSWNNVFRDFGVAARCESTGKLDQIIEQGVERYNNIFIDEAHRFRTESTATYEKLTRICRGKRVILVTATPFNNASEDILNQIKLFQSPKNSTIPNIRDLDFFFAQCKKHLNEFERGDEDYIQAVKDNASTIRESILKHLMVRRTRKEIETYFKNDLQSQKLKFPEVADPEPVFYELTEEESNIFDETIKLIVKKLKYARYKPLTYHKEGLDQLRQQSQANMGSFMMVLLVKRLESSFTAFLNTVDRFISNNKRFLETYESGDVYIGKKYNDKFFELLSSDDYEAIEKIIEEGGVERYPAKDFNEELSKDLQNDIMILEEIKNLWEGVHGDPKLSSLLDLLSTEKALRENKAIIFTEYKDTAEYLAGHLRESYPDQVLMVTGSSKAESKQEVIDNFDGNVPPGSQKDDYRILVTTEVLSEGLNLHRSNAVINYDIPWNPTRLMQRVGRVNRIDTAFDKIYSFNFFPTKEANEKIKLKEVAIEKIHAFITLLGADARILTDGEIIESHELFNRLSSKETIIGEDEEGESELKHLRVIQSVREKDSDLFEKIKSLPKKARTAREHQDKNNQLLSYFRKGKTQKYFVAQEDTVEELTFIDTANRLEANESDPRKEVPADDFYAKLGDSKKRFNDVVSGGEQATATSGGSSLAKLLKHLKAAKDYKPYTEEQEAYYERVMKFLVIGDIPKKAVSRIWNDIQEETPENKKDPIKILNILTRHIKKEYLEEHFARTTNIDSPAEVILSEYLISAK